MTEGTQARPERVMVLEPDAERRQMLAQTLMQSGFRCFMADSVHDALPFYQDRQNSACMLTILNARLPWCESVELLSRAQENDWPVLFLTAEAANVAHLQSLFDLPCDALVHPFSPKQLMNAVENLLLSISQKQLECHIVCRGSTAPYDAQFRQYCSYEDVLSLMTYLRDLFKTRAAAKKEYAASHTEAECEAYLRTAFPPVIVLFEDYNAFCAMSYSPGTRVSYTDVWETLLKNGRGYGVTFLAVWNRALYQQNFQKQAVQLFLSYQTGVHLGGKLDAQRAIETGLSITEQARIRPPETGFALEGTRLSEVYLPRTAAPAEEL